MPKHRFHLKHRILLSALLLAVAAGVVTGGYAAFTSVVSTGSNTITAGTLQLTTNANITGSVTDMKPGDTYVRCVKVTNSGANAIDAEVKVRIGGDETGKNDIPNSFSDSIIKYSVEYGTGNITDSSSSAGCSPFSSEGTVLGAVSSGYPTEPLTKKDANNSAALSGDLSGGITAGTSKSFRIMFQLDNSATNLDTGKSLTYYLVFDASSVAGTVR